MVVSSVETNGCVNRNLYHLHDGIFSLKREMEVFFCDVYPLEKVCALVWV